MAKSRSSFPAGSTRAFTLIELMVSVAVIAVLLGLLLPALHSARNAGYDLKCLSNLHQIAIGWVMYLEDHESFPVFDGNRVSMQWDWGGVDWYDVDYDPSNYYSVSLADSRPVNPYIGADLTMKARTEIFQCPRDEGLLVWGTGERFFFGWEADYDNEFNLPFEAHETNAEDPVDSLYAILGNSYRANEWMWVKPSFNGIPDPEIPLSQFMNTIGSARNKAVHVEDPSRFILVGDGGPFQLGRFKEEDRFASSGYNWWHGHPGGAACNMAFLDGSARRVILEEGKAVTSDYSFPMIHSYWKDGGALFPLWTFGYPSDDDDEKESTDP